MDQYPIKKSWEKSTPNNNTNNLSLAYALIIIDNPTVK